MQKTQLTTQNRQNQKIGPGVQLALKFLQLPAVELRSWLSNEILLNPLLDLEDDCEEALSDSEDDETPDLDHEAASDQDFLPESSDDEVAALPRGILEASGPLEREDSSWEPSSVDRLREQLHWTITDQEVLAAAEYWLGCLDEKGYTKARATDVAEDLGITLAVAESALTRIRLLDPPGVGANDLRDCLLLQLERRGGKDTLAWRVVCEKFDDLAHGRHSALRRRFGLSKPQLQEVLGEIRELDPRPLRAWEPENPSELIVPDLMVTKIGGRFEVLPVDRALPRLRLGPGYEQWLEQLSSRPCENESQADAYLRDRLRAARWILQALDRRRETMVRVMRAIVEEQPNFFRHGPAALGPLNLQTIARRVGLHESTVARVTQSKHVQTPVGVFPLKVFFSSRLGRGRHGTSSGRAVAERIRMLIRQEDPYQPLTDDEIAAILEREGVRVARRTVAKYRIQLQIGRAQLRKRFSSEEEPSQSKTDVRLRWAKSEKGSPKAVRKRIA